MLVVIGCGNLNRSDDGVGVIVAQRLIAEAARLVRPSDGGPSRLVKIFDAGTNGMDILYRARGASRLVIIDACASGSEPGAIFEAPGHELENKPVPSYSLHDFRWDHALYAGRRIWANDFPTEVTVFLIEAQTLDLGFALSDPVARAADLVTARIGALIGGYAKNQPAQG